jgi:hypothetical protein
MAWSERLRAEDRLDLNNRNNLGKLSLLGSYEDRPPRGTATLERRAAADNTQLTKLHQMLRTADPRNTGRIELQELRWIAAKSAIDLDHEATATLIDRIDEKKDGVIPYARFEKGVCALLSGPDDRPPSTPAAERTARSLPRGTPRDPSELIQTENPYASSLYHFYKARRMLQPANLRLTTPPQQTAPNTSHLFHESVYRTKNRSLKSWQDFQNRHNVLIQRQNSFPGVPTYLDTGISSYQREFTAGGPVVDPGIFSSSTQVRAAWGPLAARASAQTARPTHCSD